MYCIGRDHAGGRNGGGRGLGPSVSVLLGSGHLVLPADSYLGVGDTPPPPLSLEPFSWTRLYGRGGRSLASRPHPPVSSLQVWGLLEGLGCPNPAGSVPTLGVGGGNEGGSGGPPRAEYGVSTFLGGPLDPAEEGLPSPLCSTGLGIWPGSCGLIRGPPLPWFIGSLEL